MAVQIGDTAPDFTLPADGGTTVTLSHFRGRPIVLYFYPKDDTSGCTKEACAFRDAGPDIDAAGAVVIGVSRDSPDRHDRFKAKHGLPFTLVSDLDGKVCEAYGTWVEKSLYGRRYWGIDRATFVIDEAGVIRAIWRKVKVPGHVEAVVAAVSSGGAGATSR